MAKVPLEQVAPGLLRCPHCGKRIKTDFPPERYGHMCPVLLREHRTERRIAADAAKEKQKDLDAETVEAACRLAEQTGEPGLVEKARHYAKALLRWREARYPVRTEDEVADVVRTCKACPNDKYDAEKEKCLVCGCRVSMRGAPIRNKAKMATEHCPGKSRAW